MLVINTTLGEEVGVDDVYKGCIIQMRGYDLRVDLVPLEIHDFDIIL
jgi:vacuolar-type H+-ATPase subunit E/Vma4